MVLLQGVFRAGPPGLTTAESLQASQLRQQKAHKHTCEEQGAASIGRCAGDKQDARRRSVVVFKELQLAFCLRVHMLVYTVGTATLSKSQHSVFAETQQFFVKQR